jgi:hypothetical protein
MEDNLRIFKEEYLNNKKIRFQENTNRFGVVKLIALQETCQGPSYWY